jgi:agmatine deiminase
MSKTPAQLGFRHLAEWELHAATWIGWPHNRSDWPGKIEAIHWVYGEIVRKIVSGERVRILVNSRRQGERARRVLRLVGVDLRLVDFAHIPTNRGWTRDMGPIFVTHQQESAVVRFRFNAWAKYPDWQKDARVAERAARLLECRIFPAPVVLEGGAIDTNGRGTLITTEECLLDSKIQARNPGLGRKGTEAALQKYLGVKNILWLGKGIAGDDTHGHVDDLCRFVSPNTVVLCRENRAGDENYRALEDNWERAAGFRLEDGSKLNVVALPMPSPLYFRGLRLPASYANFYICNAAVLVPTFNDPQDRVALGVLAELFRDRPVLGIHAVDLVWGLGTIHCLTQQEPAA